MKKRFWWTTALSFAVTFPLHAADPDLLLQQFERADASQRIALVDHWGRHSAVSTDAIAALVRGLSDENAEVRWRAARALSSKGTVGDPAIAALVAALNDTNPTVRTYAAYALGKVAGTNTSAAQALASHVTDESPAVQRESISALRNLQVDPAIIRPVVAKALSSGNPTVVASAAEIMASMGAEALPEVLLALNNEETRYWATLVIQDLGPAAHEAVLPLTSILKSPDSEERLEAALALAAIGPVAKSAAANLSTLLSTDPQPNVKLAAAFALGKLEVPTVADAPLLASTSSNDPILQLVSTWALHRIYPQNKPYATEAEKLILAGIQSENAQLRSMAARTLAESNVALNDSSPLIVAALRYSSPAVVERAVKAIVAEGEKALGPLKTGLADEQLRISALRLVQQLGPQASGLLDEVRGLLVAEDPTVRREALFALAAMGEAAHPALEDITKAYLAGTSRQDRLAAIYAAGRMGPAATGLIEPLREVAADLTDEQLHTAASWALSQIATDDATAVQAAVRAMTTALETSNRPAVKISLINSLAELGAQAKGATVVLTQLQTDPNAQVRQAATVALGKIGQ